MYTAGFLCTKTTLYAYVDATLFILFIAHTRLLWKLFAYQTGPHAVHVYFISEFNFAERQEKS